MPVIILPSCILYLSLAFNNLIRHQPHFHHPNTVNGLRYFGRLYGAEGVFPLVPCSIRILTTIVPRLPLKAKQSSEHQTFQSPYSIMDLQETLLRSKHLPEG
ncbi:hypothetical protein EDD18DRAFT_1202246 [Armillaria luteobubalina]|uniref:Uncharacterized protein n=1 Tax=Armillaria luteobubalina TaxID=153913 RepID=A0AA39P815_9AGAR|nr:hypothetical protein EDD18DRAFT_1207984 [Armillaria luteobubalina]KAK0481971.1 hypothetical protein EDD18DRAFT_1202246 [Armillaria luteobubalina]